MSHYDIEVIRTTEGCTVTAKWFLNVEQFDLIREIQEMSSGYKSRFLIQFTIKQLKAFLDRLKGLLA